MQVDYIVSTYCKTINLIILFNKIFIVKNLKKYFRVFLVTILTNLPNEILEGIGVQRHCVQRRVIAWLCCIVGLSTEALLTLLYI